MVHVLMYIAYDLLHITRGCTHRLNRISVNFTWNLTNSIANLSRMTFNCLLATLKTSILIANSSFMFYSLQFLNIPENLIIYISIANQLINWPGFCFLGFCNILGHKNGDT